MRRRDGAVRRMPSSRNTREGDVPVCEGLARPQPAYWEMPAICPHIPYCWLPAYLAHLRLVPCWIGSVVISGHGWYMD